MVSGRIVSMPWRVVGTCLRARLGRTRVYSEAHVAYLDVTAICRFLGYKQSQALLESSKQSS